MSIVNILLCALFSAMIGGRFDLPNKEIPRYIPIIGFGILLLIQSPNFGWWCAWMYAFSVIRLLSTGGLFQAVTNEVPTRNGSRLEIALYEITMRIWRKLPDKMTSWYAWGIIYGFLRGLPILPAAWYLGSYALLFAPFIGVIYYTCGVAARKLKKSNIAIASAEIIIGGLVGAML